MAFKRPGTAVQSQKAVTAHIFKWAVTAFQHDYGRF